MQASNKKQTWISVREFAKQIGTSHTAVQKAIQEGKMVTGYDAETKKANLSIAKRDAWVVQQSNIKRKPGVSRAKMIEKLEQQQEAVPAGEERKTSTIDKKKILNMPLPELIASIKVRADMPFRESSRLREIVALALDKLKLMKEEGLLVDKAKVQSQLFNFGNEMKKELFNIPKRIARDMMVAPNEVEAINIMNDELTRVLSYYSNFKLTVV